LSASQPARSFSDARALVLFSGGQDSTTCLAWALERYAHVETVSFDYGQRHRIELDARLKVLAAIRNHFPLWHPKLGDDHLIDLSVLGAMSDTALTSAAEIKMTAAGLPNTFVPGRNLLFLTFAAALGYRRELTVMVGGMCETDFSGYPDCRDDTVKALQVAVSLGMGQRFTFETPLMWIDKAETWALAHALGGEELVNIILEESHTCYLGERGQRHPWGYGCGQCPACSLRKAGYHRWSQIES
jgi:7-cyano-7-deazaguanine synthase